MMKNLLLNKFNKRTIIFSGIAIFIVMVIILNSTFLSPLFHSIRKLDDTLSMKSNLLEKYRSLLGKEESYQNTLKELESSYSNLEKFFFLSKTEDLAQANLQEFIKNVARKNGILVSRSSSKKGKLITDKPSLMVIHAKIEINDVDKMEKIQSFLYNIEYENEKLIFVDELKLRSSGFDISTGVSATITLSTIAKLETKA
ncbi:MAG: GspMb/PilO family protein [Candidatus Scalindua sp.]|nr:GspMb/PilO family protein [Candidatus Scalindua sp.]